MSSTNAYCGLTSSRAQDNTYRCWWRVSVDLCSPFAVAGYPVPLSLSPSGILMPQTRQPLMQLGQPTCGKGSTSIMPSLSTQTLHKTNCTNAYTRYLSDRSYSQLISSPPSTGFFLELRFDDCGLWVAGLMPAKVAESTMHLHTNTREAQVQIQAWILFECLFE